MAKFKVGMFNQPAAGTFIVTGVGFQPKAIIFWSTGGTVEGTWGGNVFQGIGFTTGPTESFAMGAVSINGQDPTRTDRGIGAYAINMVNTDGGSHTRASLVSFDSDGFTLNFVERIHSGVDYHWLAIGGDEVSAKAVSWLSRTTVGTQSVTGVGFQPDTVIHLASVLEAIPATNADFSMCIGVMDSAGNQWTNSVRSDDAEATSWTSRIQRTDLCLAPLEGQQARTIDEASYVSMDADGFTVNFTSKVYAAGFMNMSLCLSNVLVKAGNFVKTTTTPQSITGVGFKPEAIIFSCIHHAGSTAVVSANYWSMGATDGTRNYSALQGDDTGQAASVAHSTNLYGAAASSGVHSGGVPTTKNAGALSSFDSNGFTLDWVYNDTAYSPQFVYLSFGSTNLAPNTPTALTVTSSSTDATPNFSASVTDPNAGEQIKGRFEIQTAAGGAVGTVDSAFRAGDGTVTAEYASALPLGEYRVRVKALDDDGLESAFTAFVSFKVTANVAPVDTQYLWNVRAYISKDIQALWDIAINAQKDVQLIWNTQQNVSIDLQMVWAVSTPWTEVTETSDIWTEFIT